MTCSAWAPTPPSPDRDRRHPAYALGRPGSRPTGAPSRLALLPRRRCLICPHALGWHNNRPLVLAHQTGGETSSGALPVGPRQRWRVFFVDEAGDVVADIAAPWGTAENYNPAHPFPAVDEVVVAVPGPRDGT
jgi:hypothetical protein